MVIRIVRTLQVGAFPLAALLGVGLLVAGYFEWRKFFAELYLEETAAIEAAVAAGLEVEYRREGEPRARIALRRTDWGGEPVETAWDRERSTVPDNAPFLGRVESVVLRSPRYSTAAPAQKETREALLRLPGMKAYDESGLLGPLFEDVVALRSGEIDADEPEIGKDSSSPPTLEQALGSRLPDLPVQELTVAEATKPLPRGRPLETAERETLAAEIAKAWQRESDLESYVARSSWSPNDGDDYRLLVTEVADDERFASLIEESTSPGSLDESVSTAFWGSFDSLDALRLVEGDAAHVLDRIGDRWCRTATFASKEDASAKSSSLPYFSQDRFAPALLALRSVPQLFAESYPFAHHFLSQDGRGSIGPTGENVAAIERIDDVRLRVEVAPREDYEIGGQIQATLIVREDLNYAVERSLVTLESRQIGKRLGHRIETFLDRRLASVEDAVFAKEMLRVERTHEHVDAVSGPRETREHAERMLTTVVPASDLPGAAFDPATYDPATWPERRALPIVRSYQVLWSIGGGLVAIGVIGPLFARRRSLRRQAVASEGAENEISVRRPPRFRFGLAALFAAALGLISVAGAIKQVRDEALKDIERVARLEGAAQYERRDPSFPWSLVSTPALPIDAPVKRIVVQEVAEDGENALARDAVRELLASPGLDSFLDRSQDDGPRPTDDVLYEAATALQRGFPELPEPMPEPQIAIWLEEFPDGEAMEERELSAFVAQMARAWTDLRGKVPRRYLLVESHDHYGAPEERVTLGDGERLWALGGRGGVSVTTHDGVYLYRFGLREGGPSLIERTRRGSSPMTWSAFPDVELYAMATPMHGPRMRDGSESMFAIERPGRFPDPPYAFPTHLYDDIENFEAVAQAALDPARIVRVARLDENRVRVDFAAVEVELSEGTGAVASDWETDLDDAGDGVWIDLNLDLSTQRPPVKVDVSDLTIVVREDLDFAVERSYVDAFVHRTTALGPSDRTTYLTNQLVRPEEGLVVPESARVGDRRGGARTWWDSRFAYDFAPELDERIFASPSMSDLQPIPAPVPRWTVTWPWATGGLSVVLFVGLGARRFAGTIRGRRALKERASA